MWYLIQNRLLISYEACRGYKEEIPAYTRSHSFASVIRDELFQYQFISFFTQTFVHSHVSGGTPSFFEQAGEAHQADTGELISIIGCARIGSSHLVMYQIIHKQHVTDINRFQNVSTIKIIIIAFKKLKKRLNAYSLQIDSLI